MKRGRTESFQSHAHKSVAEAEEPLYFRLCHLCLHLNESQSEVGRCHQCGRWLTSENSGGMTARTRLSENFDDTEVEVSQSHLFDADDADEEGEDDFFENPVRRSHQRINGLAVVW